VVENNYIHDCSLNGITLWGSPSDNTQTVTKNCVIRNNRLYRNEMVGIDVAGRDHLIEGNEVWGTVQCHPNVVAVEGPGCPNYSAVGGLDADGMRFFGSGHIFRKNYIHDIKFGAPENINPHIDCFQTWSGTYNEAASNILFEQNRCIIPVFQNMNEAGNGFMLAEASYLTIKNNIIKTYGGVNTGNPGNHHLTFLNNNWITDPAILGGCSPGTNCWPGGIGLQNTPYCTIKNNIFYDHHWAPIYIAGTSSTGLDRDYNLAYRSDGVMPAGTPQAHEKWGVDPKFVNTRIDDYHLQPISPAIDQGTTISSVSNDYDGVSRPQGAAFDIGAYEWTPLDKPSPPRNLRVAP
jgi:hypothetical protein